MKNTIESLRMFLWLTLLTGILYPLAITVAAHFSWPQSANGNLLLSQDKIIGAPLLAQAFNSHKYFWPRPSAVDYNPLPSGGSNLGPTSAKLKELVESRQAMLLKAHGGEKSDIPAELLFASGSGLDPHIKASTANYQIMRISKSRDIPSEEIANLINSMSTSTYLHLHENPYVNVLLLNHALDALGKNHATDSSPHDTPQK